MNESFIYERLKALSGGLERSVYRDISKAFEEVVRYNEKALDELKQSLHKELRDVSERFYLYGAVAAVGDVPIVNDFLFSMDEEQVEHCHHFLPVFQKQDERDLWKQSGADCGNR